MLEFLADLISSTPSQTTAKRGVEVEARGRKRVGILKPTFPLKKSKKKRTG